MSDPEIDAPNFDVSNVEWNTAGLPTLTFQITYHGPNASVMVNYQVTDAAGKKYYGELNGSVVRGVPTVTFISFNLGVPEIKYLKFTANE